MHVNVGGVNVSCGRFLYKAPVFYFPDDDSYPECLGGLCKSIDDSLESFLCALGESSVNSRSSHLHLHCHLDA